VKAIYLPKYRLALPLVLVLAACSSTPPPVPGPVPTPTARPSPVPLPPRPAGDWRDAPITPGNWSWAMESGFSTARFGPSLTQTRFLIKCTTDKRVVGFGISGIASVGGPIRFTTTSGTRVLSAAVGSDSGVLGMVGTSVGPRDPLLDAIAFSRGRFMVEVAGLPPLYLPSWPEVSRVIEDCR
jgi:hypothetical protein